MSKQQTNMNILVRLSAIGVLTLAGCGTTMESVMAKCDNNTKYDTYAACVKTTYMAEGVSPDDHSVRGFFAHIDAIAEAYRAEKITDAQAKSQTFDAYSKTIQVSNDRAAASISRSMNSRSTTPIDVQSTMPKPTNTNCTRIGGIVGC